jgi:Cof subfamily protein (haloacid dehalogenase superfamily)
MDGTLLNSNGTVSEKNMEAIKAAGEKGVKITISTGRLFVSARYYAELLGVKVPIIASNGAYIREKDRNDIIYKSLLGKENAMRILKVFNKFGINPHYHTSETIFTGEITRYSSRYAKFNEGKSKESQIKIELVEDWEQVFNQYEDEIVKCICMHDDSERIMAAKKELLEYEELEVVSSLKDNFEVMCNGVSKGRAVEVLANMYGFKREEIVCIGDNENDLSMIKYAGLGIAMGNAEDEVKKEADFVTKSNDEDGVAYAIDKFILGY